MLRKYRPIRNVLSAKRKQCHSKTWIYAKEQGTPESIYVLINFNDIFIIFSFVFSGLGV
jgi:hypothetical protein